MTVLGHPRHEGHPHRSPEQATHVITDEQLLRLPDDGRKYEVVDAQLVRTSPAGWPHAAILARLIVAVGSYVQARRLGTVIGSNVMFVLPGGNKRSPDVSFVAAGRLDSETNRPFPRARAGPGRRGRIAQ